MPNQPAPIRMKILESEVVLLFKEAVEREDFDRAEVWAGLLLRANDDEECQRDRWEVA